MIPQRHRRAHRRSRNQVRAVLAASYRDETAVERHTVGLGGPLNSNDVPFNRSRKPGPTNDDHSRYALVSRAAAADTG